jgi:hypothetical protein
VELGAVFGGVTAGGVQMQVFFGQGWSNGCEMLDSHLRFSGDG